MNKRNNSQLKRGFVDLFVLLALFQKGLYPNEIITLLNLSDIDMPEGTLYPLLNRLKNDDMLTYKWEESKSGPPRKYFFITEKGKDFITYKLELFQELYTSLHKLTENSSIKF